MTFSEVPWTDVVLDTRDYVVFKDGFPVTEGHVLFVPKVEDWEHLAKCYKAAYAWGYEWTQNGYCDAYNVGQNIGEAAGQTIMYPHVHLIPRRKGDMEDPRGGVRHVIPEKGNYRKSDRYVDIDDVKDIVYGDGC
jgi:diadenosine tetraphosphate (Ap4A) HIT family hydrolase